MQIHFQKKKKKKNATKRQRALERQGNREQRVAEERKLLTEQLLPNLRWYNTRQECQSISFCILLEHRRRPQVAPPYSEHLPKEKGT
jgi:hypothetical protein